MYIVSQRTSPAKQDTAQKAGAGRPVASPLKGMNTQRNERPKRPKRTNEQMSERPRCRRGGSGLNKLYGSVWRAETQIASLQINDT